MGNFGKNKKKSKKGKNKGKRNGPKPNKPAKVIENSLVPYDPESENVKKWKQAQSRAQTSGYRYRYGGGESSRRCNWQNRYTGTCFCCDTDSNDSDYYDDDSDDEDNIESSLVMFMYMVLSSMAGRVYFVQRGAPPNRRRYY